MSPGLMPHPQNQLLRAWEESGRYLRVGGRPIFTWERGSGRALVCLHGFPVSSYDFRHLAGLMPERRIIGLDFPGFGLSDKSPDGSYSIFTYADVVELVLEELQVDACDLVAHDMGDTVASELLCRAHEGKLAFEISSLTLLNGSIFIDLAQLTSGQKLLLRLPPRRLPFALPPRLFRQQIRELFSKEHPLEEGELEGIEGMLEHAGGSRMAPLTIRYIEERRTHQDRWTRGLTEFDGRLAALWGLQDPVAIPKMVDHLEDLRPSTHIARWDDVGHCPHVEAPGRVAKELEALLP